MKYVILRIISLIPALLSQVLWLVLLINWLSPFAVIINTVLSILAALLVLVIINKRAEGAYRSLWLLIILTFPILGTLMYLSFEKSRTTRRFIEKITNAGKELPKLPPADPEAVEQINSKNKRFAQTVDYVTNHTDYPIMENEQATYYPVGEDMWTAMLEDMKKAKKYIFAEYFILEEGHMWNSITEIMAQKVKEGVDVRVLYDDVGSLKTYTKRNARGLVERGIKVTQFNPLVFLSGTVNNRDHRKMLIVDGEIAYTGGINMADEYINAIEKFGHWKDIGFRTVGKPVYSYIYMFAEFWNAYSKDKIPEEYLAQQENLQAPDHPDGYILSYCDFPMRPDPTSNNLYIELLSQATERVWFYTPYLMLGDTLHDAFVRAAHRGIDVRIIMPGSADKDLINRISRSYYPVLIEEGVRIFEYTPGFIHAKACLVDHDICAIGTVNLDYRSLFLHFENNAVFFQASIFDDLEKDYYDTLAQSQEIYLEDTKRGPFSRIIDGILRIFAPLC